MMIGFMVSWFHGSVVSWFRGFVLCQCDDDRFRGFMVLSSAKKIFVKIFFLSKSKF